MNKPYAWTALPEFKPNKSWIYMRLYVSKFLSRFDSLAGMRLLNMDWDLLHRPENICGLLQTLSRIDRMEIHSDS